MPISSWIADLIGGGAAKIVESVGDTAKKFITTEADRQQFELELRRAGLDIQRLEMDAESKRLDDVASARDMYKTDSSVQKWIALAFVIAYFLLTGLMLWMLTGWLGLSKSAIPDWGITLISTIFGAMSAKVSTVVDFYFGSSKGSHDKDETFASDVKTIMSSKQE